MKRAGNLYPLIGEPDNLRLAFLEAARRKQGHHEVLAFRGDLAGNLARLREQLLAERPDIGHYRFFEVYDPKRRQICAAPFAERVLHHAVMNICEPVLDAYSIYDSYACLPGKGAHRAVARAREFVGASGCYLKLDIRKYFNSIDHAIMLELLVRRFKDRQLLALFAKILATYQVEPGKGLPIGNLVSQHLANFYLGLFDHWVKEELRIGNYLRYMDDFVLFADGREKLRELLPQLAEFLGRRLGLTFKDNVQLNRCRAGLPFLGYRIFPQTVRLTPRSRSRFVRRFRENEREFLAGQLSERNLVRRMEPLVDFTRVAAAAGFRRQVIRLFGVSS